MLTSKFLDRFQVKKSWVNMVILMWNCALPSIFSCQLLHVAFHLLAAEAMAIYGSFLKNSSLEVPFAARCKRRINEMRQEIVALDLPWFCQKRGPRPGMLWWKGYPFWGRGDPQRLTSTSGSVVHLERSFCAIFPGSRRGKSWAISLGKSLPFKLEALTNRHGVALRRSRVWRAGRT